MNKLFTKIVGAALGLTMAIGVGVAVANNNRAIPVSAVSDSDSPFTLTTGGNLTATSGNFLGGAIVMTSEKNSSSNNPAYYAAGIRYYYNSGGNGGGSTFTFDGITVSEVVLTGVSSYTPTVKYNVDGGNDVQGTWSGTTMTINNLSASTSFKFRNANTSNTQLRISGIKFTFTTSGGGSTYLSVTYDLNGGTGGTVVDSNEYESGDEVEVLGIGSVTKTDYTFVNWSDGSTTYDEGDIFTITSNVTLTAQWQYKQYDDDTVNNKITWTLSGPSYVNASANEVNWTSPKATMVISKESASSPANNYCPPAQTSTRFYANSVLTITPVSGYQINSIVFTATTNNYATALSNSTWTNASASASNTTVTVTPTNKKNAVSATIGATTGHTSVVVNYAVATSTPTVTLDTYSVDLKTNQINGVFVTATVENVASPTYTWSTDDANISLENVKTNKVTIKPNTSVAGTATVSLVVGGVSPNLEASVSVTISVPGPGETPETAYTVAQAKAAVDAGTGITNVYAKGIVSSLYSQTVSSGKISYYISDDGSTSGTQLEAYKGKGLNDTNFVSIDDIQVGDEVIIFGTLTLYNTTYEFTEGNYLVSQLRKKVNSITLTPTTITVEPGDTGSVLDLFTSIVIDQDEGLNYTSADIVWTSSDSSIFDISNGSFEVTGSHKDSANITGTLKGTSAIATISVVDPNHPILVIDMPDDWTVITDPSTLSVGDSVIITGTNSGTTYAASTYSSGNNVRADTDNLLTIAGTKATGVVSTMVYTLEEGSVDGSLAFKDSAGKYLCAASSSSNYMKAQDEINGNSSFILNSNGTVVAQGSYTRNYMRFNYNNGSPLFACYASNSSTGTLVTFYKNNGGTTSIDLNSDIMDDLDDYFYSGDFFECDPNGVSFDSNGWNEVGDIIADYKDTYHLNYARANESGNKVEQFLATYDYVIAKKISGYTAYSDADDYLGRIDSGKVSSINPRISFIQNIVSENYTVSVIVVISLVSLTAIGGYFFLKKRKEQ